MKKDTLSFLATVLSIPVLLTGTVFAHDAISTSEVVVRDQPLYVDAVPLVEETPTVSEVVPTSVPVVQKVATPAVPPPVPTQVTAVPPPPTVKIAKIVKPTRKTRAS